MKYGTAWYPEHWHKSQWEHDLNLMRQAGMNVVRIAEGAWSIIEPSEGQFDLDWLEAAVKLASDHGFEVVLGTPTYAPPAWLTTAYPEVLAVSPDGQQATHGYRCHYSVASSVFRIKAQTVARAMAERFGHDHRVIGWQIDNEYKSVSYDVETRRQFQHWLYEQYRDLDALNTRWTTRYWSQTYTDWSQIPLPLDSSPFPDSTHNPALRLAFRRFITFLYQRYQQEQIDALRQCTEPRQWFTHNFMGWFDRYDPQVIAHDLDFVSWDNYMGQGYLEPWRNGAMHDHMRGLKRRNFWLMEVQAGMVNWAGINNTLRRGETRTLVWHAIGHGADAVLYWQWQAALASQEQYHGCILGADGKPRPLFDEIVEIGHELAQHKALLEQTSVVSRVAILMNFDDLWAINQQRHHQDFDPVQHLQSYYLPLRQLGFSVDIIHPLAPLESYTLVIAPNLHVLSSGLAEHLHTFVEHGGHLVLGARSAVKNLDNALLPSLPPGEMTAWVGGVSREYYALIEEIKVHGAEWSGGVQIWAEWLEPTDPDTEVLLRYGVSNGWLDGQAAMLSRQAGQGRVSMVGFWGSADLMHHLVGWCLEKAQLTPDLQIPSGVELCRRESADYEVWIFINHSQVVHTLELPKNKTLEGFDGLPSGHQRELKPLEVCILKCKAGVSNG
jgi:beta-galactosidase